MINRDREYIYLFIFCAGTNHMKKLLVLPSTLMMLIYLWIYIIHQKQMEMLIWLMIVLRKLKKFLIDQAVPEVIVSNYFLTIFFKYILDKYMFGRTRSVMKIQKEIYA